MTAVLGMIKVGAAVPVLKVADTDFNSDEIIRIIKESEKEETGVLLFPELCITGYSCGDLFYQDQLYNKQLEALENITKATESIDVTVIAGFYLHIKNDLYNCAAVIQHGEIKGVVPKMFMPNSEEFYEARWFASGLDISEQTDTVNVNDCEVPFGNLIFEDLKNRFSFGIEICEDLWLPISPGSQLVLSGAQVLFNPSASNETIGKSEYKRTLVLSQSGKGICGYVYTSSGVTESTTDVVFIGHSMAAENGIMLAENKECYSRESTVIYTEIDIDKIRFKRRHEHNFTKSGNAYCSTYFESIVMDTMRFAADAANLTRNFSKTPFVPADDEEINSRCEDIFNIQGAGLAKRIDHSRSRKSVVGISGGLDSTLALLVTVYAHKLLGRSTEDIAAVTMPGFGTTGMTYNNALALMRLLGTDVREISISDSVLQHFKDVGQNKDLHDVTYENAQARERTQILMDIANMEGGLVVGTGDLSELALGWCTYNGDHMSMYGVNAGVPKTLVSFIIKWVIENRLQGPDEDQGFSSDNKKLAEILQAILDTPISPELLPPDENGEIVQKTEDKVGPYELHDFFIFHTLRAGMPPAKLFLIAKRAFKGVYDDAVINKWMNVFYGRFFSQQFKRSCLPDGPKVGSVSLSPRGDWRMPSDAEVAAWIEETWR